ncbi:uncharacterized protein LOC112568741 [Pomacea canaliculata]|uniref:uncharacterized protein LOC112568741 n=1 Tax=Pomacea canaliculata TaxID=400727 RepID=UPI000D73DF14|nr:uncharacterized protein LOC112568741 [Pomacea canaliculata]
MNMMFVISSLILLVLLKDCSGQVIEGCGLDSPMDVDISRNIFKCHLQMPNQCVSWHFQKAASRQLISVSCFPSINQFTTYLDNAEARRYNDTSSVLEVFSTDMSDFLSITCRVFDNIDTYRSMYMNEYTCSLTKRDSPTFSCSLQRQADNSLSVVCSILNIYIRSRDYSCELTARFQDDTTEVLSNPTFIRTEPGGATDGGSCMAHNLPNPDNIRNVEATLLPDNIKAIAILE